MNFSDKLHFRRKKNDEEATAGSPDSSIERDREALPVDDRVGAREEEHEEEEEEEVPQMNVITTIVSIPQAGRTGGADE